MYKVSLGDKTMVGCNYDSWNHTPRIWFETEGYGACFTGGRFDGSHGYAPQSGMNEFGLAFSRLDALSPDVQSSSNEKKLISNPTLYLKDILHRCKTVKEVKSYIEEYDHSYFIHDVFIYVDSLGNYLIVEPYVLTLGYDQKYVLANFCPSQISDFSTIKQAKYQKGIAFLNNKIDTSLKFCTSLSDTMHVCREKIGDGTLLTSIWDLREKQVYLNFYHDYKHQIKFDIKVELSKGDHILSVPELFPVNEEFQKLIAFQTPMNNAKMDLFVRCSLFLFLFFSGYYFFSYFLKRKSSDYRKIKIGLSVLSLISIYYMFVIGTTTNIYYFPAPYKDYNFSMLNVAAYIPFLFLFLIVPLIRLNIKVFKESIWSLATRFVLTINNLIFIALIVLFAYWGFYNIF